MPPREEMETDKKRKREIQEENRGKEIIKPPPRDELKLIQQLQLPWDMKQKIEADKWNHHDIKLVIEKKICISDMNFCYFVIPENEILMGARNFLKPDELEDLKNTSSHLEVKLLDQNLVQFDMNLSWRLLNNCARYILTQNWQEVVQRNNLRLDDMVQLWSFRRVNDELGFALVKLT